MNVATQSKIVWTSMLTAVFGMASFLGYIPEKIEAPLLIVATTGVPLLIAVFRTWFTGNK